MKFPGCAHDGKDITSLFTTEQLTCKKIVEHVLDHHYVPWMLHVREQRGQPTDVILTTQDSDPDQHAVFKKKFSMFEN